MRRYEKATKFYRQKNTFKTDKKKIYTELGQPIVTIEKSSSKEEVETFWTSTWGAEKDCNEETEWVK